MKRITVKKEGDGFIAFIDTPETYEWGRTLGEAIGNLIRQHSEFNIKIEIEVAWPPSSDE